MWIINFSKNGTASWQLPTDIPEIISKLIKLKRIVKSRKFSGHGTTVNTLAKFVKLCFVKKKEKKREEKEYHEKEFIYVRLTRI